MVTKKAKPTRSKTLRPHPSRDHIVDVMRSYGKPISPTQLARITRGSLGATAYHMRMLVSAGVVELAGEARVRGAVEHFYALVPGGEGSLQLTDPIIQLLALCGALTIPDPAGGYPRPAVIDDAAREALMAMIAKLSPKVRRTVTVSTARAGTAAPRKRA